MATFTGHGTGTTGASSYTLRLDIWEDSYDINSNSSLVKANLYLDSGNYNFYQVGIPRNIYIDGEQAYYDDSQIGIDTNSSILVATVEKRVYHNSDGTKTISCSASMTNSSASYLPGNISCGGDLKLTDIPRYASVSISEKRKDINSIEINWSSNANTDHRQYKINDGSWKDNGDSSSMITSGYFTISDLESDTTYKIKLRAKRTDSQLWSESNELTIKTYDYAKFTSVGVANFGSDISIKKVNESGLENKLCMYFENTLILTRNNISDSYNLSMTQLELDELYKKYSITSSSINCTYKLITTCNSKEYIDNTSGIIVLKGNAKVSKIKNNGSIKRAKVFIKKNGEIKRAVLFVKNNGYIKRCI